MTQTAWELRLSGNTLYRWMARFKKDGEHKPGQLKPEGKALRDLEKKIRDLEGKNEILKKAMHYFAKDWR